MKLKSNKPRHGLGMYAQAKQKAPLKAGAHVPLRTNSGYDDGSGYQGSPARRNGKQTGGLMASGTSDTNVRKGAVGNSKGSAPPALSKVAKSTMKAQVGRGAPGKMGKADQFKGTAKKLSESISHQQFERLGA